MLACIERAQGAGPDRRRGHHGRVRGKRPRPVARRRQLSRSLIHPQLSTRNLIYHQHGKTNRLHRISCANCPSTARRSSACSDWKEFHHHMAEKKLRKQGARCMDCGVPFCHTGTLISGMAIGCPINNLIPEWNDLVYRGLWKEALRAAAQDEQFPGVHRPRLPRAVRRLLRARHQQPAGHDQEHRGRDHRPRLGRRLGHARAAARCAPARKSPSSAPAPPASPPPRS